MTWPLNGSEVAGDLALIQAALFLTCKCTVLAFEQLVLPNKSSEVCIKTRSPSTSLPSEGQVTEQTTVKMVYCKKCKGEKPEHVKTTETKLTRIYLY